MWATAAGAETILQDFQIDRVRGFLPTRDPATSLPGEFSAWEQATAEIPKFLVAGRIRSAVRDLPLIHASSLTDIRLVERAMLLLSYLAHAYVFGGDGPEPHLPAAIAVPWYHVANLLGRPPVLSYASHALANWRRYDPDGEIRLGNIARLQNFWGGGDEDWFVLVHVAIEGQAAPALLAVLQAQAAVVQNSPEELGAALSVIASTLRRLLGILRQMPEKCDPYIYYSRVRPFIFGWLDNPGLPEGAYYEGVAEYGDRPQKFRGETGAQSSIIPSIDALCGIDYSKDVLGEHLYQLRAYMPRPHREFISHVEKGPSVRSYINQKRIPVAVEAYNECVEALRDFRAQHLEFAGLYIHAQTQRGSANPVAIGTGGTPFMKYLNAHCNALDEYLLR